MTTARRPAARPGALLVLVLVSGPLLLGSTGSATAAPPATSPPSSVRPTQTPEQRETARREAQAAEDLEGSSAAVQAAAASLRAVAAQLPAARADVDRARGELAGAKARAAAARAAVVRAERALAAARADTVAAGRRVDAGRAGVNRLARRTYQRGALSELRDVMDADDPDDVLVRAGLLRAVFRNRNDVLVKLNTDRLALARNRADVAAEERTLEQARDGADRIETRARAATVRVETASQRVTDLVARRQAALVVAETLRTQDQRDYRDAQAASAALAERIREAARRAAAAAAKARAEAAARARAEAVARARAAAAAALAERRRSAAQAAAAAAARKRGERPPRLITPRRQAAPQRADRADSGRMLWPTPGQLTSRFGVRVHPIFGDFRFHAGIDISGGEGAPLHAAEAGVVILAGDGGGYGNLTVISHGIVDGKDVTTSYAHQSAIYVSEGQVVGRGELIGAMGSTGSSTGPHLHFEVRRDGEPVDPLDYVSPP